MITRQINADEVRLISHMLSLVDDNRANDPLPKTVTVLNDGQMGSIRFSSGQERQYAKDLCVVKYTDSDNSLVLITLTEDDFGDLFELDFWKTDFNRLIIYPTPDKVTRHID